MPCARFCLLWLTRFIFQFLLELPDPLLADYTTNFTLINFVRLYLDLNLNRITAGSIISSIFLDRYSNALIILLYSCLICEIHILFAFLSGCNLWQTILKSCVANILGKAVRSSLLSDLLLLFSDASVEHYMLLPNFICYYSVYKFWLKLSWLLL